MRRVHRARRQYPRGFLYFPRRLGGRKNRSAPPRAKPKGNRLSRVQQAYVDAGAVQCGFCTPGLVMSSTAFIEKHKGQPVTREEIRRGHAGNLCRCTGYDAIIAAVESCLNDTPPQNTCACLRKPDGHATIIKAEQNQPCFSADLPCP